ncbi:MAG: hypothetical protein D6704_13650 [Nitrospirae bacterium]|nr:MAG: hypothetical protein D6704_13650 [Nitrospirota bacterium]
MPSKLFRSRRSNMPGFTKQQGLLILWVGLLFLSVTPWVMAEPPRETPLSVTLPSDLMTFQPGPGREIAAGFCLICHSADYIYMQPPHSPQQWEEIVHKMQRAFGCPIPNDQIPTLVEYLVSQNAIQPASSLPRVAESSFAGTGTVEQGRQVYEAHCQSCHGSTGKGDGPVGRMLIPPAADLTATTKADRELLHIIQNGKPGTAMPAWKGTLSPGELTAVLAYIRDLARSH